jgi:hypothetical protein
MESKGTKYIAIVFFSRESNKPSLKFEKWINDYTLGKKQFQNFLKNKHPHWWYFNLYDKATGEYKKRIYS